MSMYTTKEAGFYSDTRFFFIYEKLKILFKSVKLNNTIYGLHAL